MNTMILHVSIQSFSYRKPLPSDTSGNGGGYVFDCRALPNPGRDEKYKKKTGQDLEVIEYLKAHDVVDHYLSAVQKMLSITLSNYVERGFEHVSVSFGCTGGQHRSVYCAEYIAGWIAREFPHSVVVKLTHRDCPVFEPS